MHFGTGPGFAYIPLNTLIFGDTVTKKVTLFSAIIAIVIAFGLRVFTQVAEPPMYLAFEQRLALSYALSAVGKTEAQQEEIAEKLQSLFTQLNETEPKTVKVQSFEEFLNQWRGNWPNTHKLSIDLAQIESRKGFSLRKFESDNVEVQDRIDKYIETQTEYFKQFLKSRGVNSVDSSKAMAIGALLLGSDSQQLFKIGLAEGAKLIQSEMQIIDQLGEKIVSSGQMSQMDGGIKRVMELAIGEYFKHLSIESKAQIVSMSLGEKLNTTDMEKFEILVSGAGPQFQKLLQIMAREKSMAPELLEVFRKLESNVRPVPWSLVHKKIGSEVHNYEIISVEEKPLGVGTMAQVHRGQIKNSKGEVQSVVVRFLKPDILERVEEDRRILAELAPKIDADPILMAEKFPPLTPIVEDLTRTVLDEFDLMATMKRQDMAVARYKIRNIGAFEKYKKDFHISVPGVIWPKTGKTDLMIQELATGKKLDKVAEAYKSEIPELKKTVVEELAKMWVREVLFGEGFFHADLHQGNFMIDVGGEKVLVNLLDFGMAGVLDRSSRQAVFALAGGLEILKTKTIVDAFWQLSEKTRNKISYEEFYIKVDGLVRDMRNGILPMRSFDQWTGYAISQGLMLPYNFINLNRGFVIMNKLLSEVNSTFELSLMAKKAAISKPGVVIKALWKTESMSLFDIVKLGWYYLSNRIPVKQTQIQVQAFSLDGIAARGGLRCELLFAK